MEILYKVQCANCNENFEKLIEIKDATLSEKKETNEVLTYCPFCDEMVAFKIEGEAESDEEILRGD